MTFQDQTTATPDWEDGPCPVCSRARRLPQQDGCGVWHVNGNQTTNADTVAVPRFWLCNVVTMLNEMAGEGISIVDCEDPAELMSEIAEHLGCGDADDIWEAVVSKLNDWNQQ